MRKFFIGLAVAAIATAPAAGLAHGGNTHNDLQDGKQCRASSEPATVRLGVQGNGFDPASNADDADRASLCVKNGNTTLLYIGGELVSEDNPGTQTGVACGAIIVNGETRVGAESEDFNSNTSSFDHCD